jgi:dTDP-glucose pyrophosphorylase
MQTNWQELVIGPNISIRDSLKIIDKGALRVALVTDKDGILLGTLSDGDIRRALIQGSSLDEPISKIMNHHAKSVNIFYDENEIQNIMNKYDLLVIPVLDANGHLVDLITHNDYKNSSQKENWVLLMAGGYGTRLRPLTDNCPKPMLKVGSKPLLEIILENFIASGFYKFYISLNYMADKIKAYFGDGSRWNITIIYIDESQPLGTAGCLSILPDLENKPLLIMNGDILTKVNFDQLLHFHERNDSDLTACVREYDFKVPYGVVETLDQKVLAIKEKPVHYFFVNAGIYAISPSVIDYLTKNKKLDMNELIENLIKAKCNVSAFPIHEYWLDIGHPEDFVRAQEDVLLNFD